MQQQYSINTFTTVQPPLGDHLVAPLQIISGRYLGAIWICTNYPLTMVVNEIHTRLGQGTLHIFVTSTGEASIHAVNVPQNYGRADLIRAGNWVNLTFTYNSSRSPSPESDEGFLDDVLNLDVLDLAAEANDVEE